MRITRIVAGASLALFIALPAAAALPIQKWQQASGAQVWLIESPGLPILDVEVDFDAGDRRDPAEKAGLAGATASMSSKGVAARNGEPALDENQLGEAWADLGAGFGASSGQDRMSFTLRSLTYPDLLAKAVALGARQLGEPSFPEAVWQRDRQRWAASIREANTRPGTIAGRTFAQAVYGTHPYGYDTTEASLNRITVQDMRDFYKVVQPCRAKVSVVGAVNPPPPRMWLPTSKAKKSGWLRAMPGWPIEICACAALNGMRFSAAAASG